MHDSRVLDQLIAAARELYSLPTVAVRVLELTSLPSVDSTQLKRCIEQDPALTAKILRVVNSSLFGLSSQVADLGQAITLLGIKPLKLLVLGFCLPEGLLQDVTGPVLSRYWRRTLTKAVAARELCQQVWKLSGDEGFVVGLLADLGLLAFVQGFGEPYVRFMDRVQRLGNPLEDAERRALGFDHRQFTCRLVDEWKLPDKLRAAIAANVASPDGSLPAVVDSAAPPLAVVLFQADLLTQLLCDERSGVLGELLECGQSPLTELQLNDLVSSLSGKVQQLAEVLRLELAGSRDYGEVLSEARRQLTIVAADAAIELACRSTSVHDIDHSPHLGSDDQLADEIVALSAAVSSVVTGSSPARFATSKNTTQPVWRTRSAVKSTTSPRVSLHEQLTLAVQACRQTHAPLSLLIVETETSPKSSPGVAHRCEGFLNQVDLSNKLLVPLGDGRLAIGLVDCDRGQVSELARNMVQFLTTEQGGRKALPVYLGAATVSRPAPNFDVARLIEAAERCCYAARTATGNVLKSIEIF